MLAFRVIYLPIRPQLGWRLSLGDPGCFFLTRKDSQLQTCSASTPWQSSQAAKKIGVMLRCEEKQHRIFSIGPDHQNSLRKKIIRICYKPAEKNISSGLLTGALTSGLVLVVIPWRGGQPHRPFSPPLHHQPRRPCLKLRSVRRS